MGARDDTQQEITQVKEIRPPEFDPTDPPEIAGLDDWESTFSDDFFSGEETPVDHRYPNGKPSQENEEVTVKCHADDVKYSALVESERKHARESQQPRPVQQPPRKPSLPPPPPRPSAGQLSASRRSTMPAPRPPAALRASATPTVPPPPRRPSPVPPRPTASRTPSASRPTVPPSMADYPPRRKSTKASARSGVEHTGPLDIALRKLTEGRSQAIDQRPPKAAPISPKAPPMDVEPPAGPAETMTVASAEPTEAPGQKPTTSRSKSSARRRRRRRR